MARLPTIDLAAIPLSNGDVASMLATRGIPVFPCAADRFGPTPERPKGDPEAKKPLTRHGFKDATCDSAMLADLWKRNPEALVGISLAENRLVVIDVDGGAEGVATWEAFCAEHGIPLAGVPIVITPTGGRHYYFRLPEGLEQGNGRGNLPPKAVLNVDVRGTDSGYVIAAGTERPHWGEYLPVGGDLFAWLDAPDMPDTLVAILQSRRQHTEPAAPAPSESFAVVAPQIGLENVRVRALVETAFNDEINGVATCPPGSRNEQINRAAFALFQFVAAGLLGEREVQAALERAAEDCNYVADKGWPQTRATIRSGKRAGMKKPRAIPADIIQDEQDAIDGAVMKQRMMQGKDGAIHDEDTGEVLHDPAAAPTTARFDFPDHLTRVPGIVGEITDWITATARKPSRVLSLGAAITLMGTVMARRYSGPTESTTVLYALTLAPTAAGKDHPMQMIKAILEAAGDGLKRCIGPDEFTAATAIHAHLQDHPQSVCCIDEMGTFLARVNSKRAAGFERGISKTLRTQWGTNFGSMSTPGYAGKAGALIYAPAMSIYGVSTPAEFFNSLDGADVINGLLNRFLLFSIDVRPESLKPALSSRQVPTSIAEGVIKRFHDGNPHLASMGAGDSTERIAPIVIPWATPAAEALFEMLERDILAKGDANPKLEPYLGRTAEMSVRLATIRAYGINCLKPAVTVADMQWGIDVAWWSAGTMMRMAGLYMAENEHQAAANRIIRIIADAGGRATKSAIKRSLRNSIRKRDLDDLLTLMQESGTFRVEQTPAPPTGGFGATWCILEEPP